MYSGSCGSREFTSGISSDAARSVDGFNAPGFWKPARRSSISAAPSVCVRPRTTSSGTRPSTRSPSCCGEAAYGLPEFCRERIPAARLVSNPGCYPTAANLAIRPLVEQGVIDRIGRHRLRRQIRRQRRGPQAVAENQLLRGHGELLRLLDPQPPARARGAHDLRPGGARVQLHRATAADRPRHPRNHLFPRRRGVTARAICSRSTRSATPASRSSASTIRATCPICAPLRAPTSATSA